MAIRWEFIESTISFQSVYFRALLRRAITAHGRLEILLTLFDQDPIEFYKELQNILVDVRSKYLQRTGGLLAEDIWDRLAQRQLNDWWTSPSDIDCPTINISPSAAQIVAYEGVYREAVRIVCFLHI